MPRHWYATVAIRPEQIGGGQVFHTFGQAHTFVQKSMRRAKREGFTEVQPAFIEITPTLAEALKLAGD